MWGCRTLVLDVLDSRLASSRAACFIYVLFVPEEGLKLSECLECQPTLTCRSFLLLLTAIRSERYRLLQLQSAVYEMLGIIGANTGERE